MGSTMIVRITGIAQLLLGVMIWMGNAGGLVPVHMLIGLIFVLAMWILGFRAMRAGVSGLLAGILLLWGAAILAIGMTQAQLMPGPNHAAIQIAHVVMGLIGMGLSEMVGKRMRIASGGVAAS